jgi:hypothetical protein
MEKPLQDETQKINHFCRLLRENNVISSMQEAALEDIKSHLAVPVNHLTS